jgi:hypothetical protein
MMKCLVVGFIGLGITGCAGPRMLPPKDVSEGAKVLEVVDRSRASGALVDESFKLGSYQVKDVDRDWNTTKKSSGFFVSKTTTTTGYTFKLLAGKDTWEGACGMTGTSKGVGNSRDGVQWGSDELSCECKRGNDSASVSLKADQADAKHRVEGDLTFGETKYDVHVVNDSEGSNFTNKPAGFRFDSSAGAVAAVEMLHPGRVWLTPHLPETQYAGISCISAGLMLYQPPSNH